MASGTIKNTNLFQGEVPFSYSASANSSYLFNAKTLVDSALPAGTEFVSWSGWATGSSSVCVVGMYYGDSTASGALRNVSGSAVSTSAKLYFTYRYV